MRTTLTPDDDVAAKLRRGARRSRRSFREGVNAASRRGPDNRTFAAGPFLVHARHLGNLRPGLDLDNVAELPESVESPGIDDPADANLLWYAYHPRSSQHDASRAWLETTLSGSESVRFTWPTLWVFLRISTSPPEAQRPYSSPPIARPRESRRTDSNEGGARLHGLGEAGASGPADRMFPRVLLMKSASSGQRRPGYRSRTDPPGARAR